MPDTKLSNLPQSTLAKQYYGIDSTPNSARFADPGFYNVKNFGASVGTGGDDQPAIQAAVTAAATSSVKGGIVFFPPGNYILNSSVTFDHLSQAALRIVGSGGTSQAGGTYISTNNQIWMFQTDHGPATGNSGGQAVSSFENLTLQNNFNPGAHGTITSTETSGGGFGCIYMTTGVGVRYESLGLYLGTAGILVYDSGFDCSFNNCQMLGPFARTHAEDTFGIIFWRGSITNSSMQAFGRGIIIASHFQSFSTINLMQIEDCGCALLCGETPILLYDQFNATTFNTGASGSVICTNVGFESNGSTDASGTQAVVKFNGLNHLIDCVITNQAAGAQTQRGIWLVVWQGSIEDVQVFDNGGANAWGTAGIDIDSIFSGEFIRVSSLTGFPVQNPSWKMPTSASWRSPSGGARFLQSNQGGAVAFADLPPTPIAFGVEMVCNNSTVSTFGSTIGGTSGGSTVVARWNGSVWVVA